MSYRLEPRLDSDLNNYLNHLASGMRPDGEQFKEIEVVIQPGWVLGLLRADGGYAEQTTQNHIRITALITQGGVLFNIRSNAWEVEMPLVEGSLDELHNFIRNNAYETGFVVTKDRNGMRI